MFTLIATILFIGIAIYGYTYYKDYNQKRVVVESIKTEKARKLEESINKLVLLNLSIRQKIENTNTSTNIEIIIDKVIELLYKETSNEVLFERIASKYLPNLVDNYIITNQEANLSSFENELKSLETQLDTMINDINTGNELNFSKTSLVVNKMMKQLEDLGDKNV